MKCTASRNNAIPGQTSHAGELRTDQRYTELYTWAKTQAKGAEAVQRIEALDKDGQYDKVLNLGGLELTTLPPLHGFKFTKIKADNNRLEELNPNALPETLVCLDVHCNLLTNIPSGLPFGQLKLLNIAKNLLRNLPDGIKDRPPEGTFITKYNSFRKDGVSHEDHHLHMHWHAAKRPPIFDPVSSLLTLSEKFMVAVKSGNDYAVQLFLNDNAHIGHQECNVALREAINNKHRKVSEQYPDENHTDNRTHSKIAELLLLDDRTDPYQEDLDGTSAVTLLLQNKDAKLFECLIQNRCFDPNKTVQIQEGMPKQPPSSSCC